MVEALFCEQLACRSAAVAPHWLDGGAIDYAR